MKRRLRRFVAVGAVVTAVDVALLAGLVTGAGWPVWAGALAAVAAASVASFALHRVVTFADDTFALIDHRPGAFAAVATPAALVDVATVVLVAGGSPGVTRLLVAKGLAVAAADVVRLVTYRRALFAAVRQRQVVAPDRPTLDGDVRLSVIVPAYRDADRIGTTIERLRAELAPLAREGRGAVEVIVVDDGSCDGTADRASAGGADVVLVQDRNRGKGAAVRRGMLAARGRTVAFTDADLAYPPAQLMAVAEQVEAGFDVVVGNRRHPGTRIHRRAPRLREVGSVAFNLITYLVLLGAYRDTQCGLKAFRRDAARLLFSQSRVDGFAFDVETLHLVERHHLSLREVPVVLEDEARSTVSLIPSALAMIGDVVGVRRWSGRGGYDLMRPVADELAALAPVAAPVRSSAVTDPCPRHPGADAPGSVR